MRSILTRTLSSKRLGRLLAIVALAGAGTVAVAGSAEARDGYWGHRWEHWHHPHYWGHPWAYSYQYGPRYYFAPPVVAYPPAYDPPVYYGPPGVSLNFNL